MIKEGRIPTPYYLQHRHELVQRGVDAPWATEGLLKGRQFSPTSAGRAFGPELTPSGNLNALLILVQFSDKAKQVTATSFDHLVFSDSAATVKDYYKQVSYSTLDIVTVNLPSSIGWVTAPQTYAYYVNGQNGFGSYPQNAQRLVEDVVNAVSSVVDFSKYDNDHDGYVDALFIAHAGPGAEFTGSNNDIWSHSWTTYTPLLHNGVYVYHYAMAPEYWLTPGDMTCGVYCHELGHALFGLPDLYDTDYSSEGLGDWSLMAGGSWNGATGMGESPSLPDAWCRYQMGFVTPTNLTSNVAGKQIRDAELNNVVYRLWTNGYVSNEYFLLENREKVGYDRYLPGSGLLIYHVDESVTTENEDEWYPGHTTSGHYLVALEQADGLFDLEKDVNRGDSGDPYPGSSENRNFSPLTVPGSRDYYGNNTYVKVEHISDPDSVMQADLSVSLVNSPVISLIPDSVNFGSVGLGLSKAKTVSVCNTGGKALVVSSIASDLPVYAASDSQLTIPPDSTYPVAITFTPVDSVEYSGHLKITSNDTAHSITFVKLSGSSFYPPAIAVSPDSFALTLLQGDSTDRSLTISNNGTGPLIWNTPLRPHSVLSQLFAGVSLSGKAKITATSAVKTIRKPQKSSDDGQFFARNLPPIKSVKANLRLLQKSTISGATPLFGIYASLLVQINPATGGILRGIPLTLSSGGPHGLCYDNAYLYLIDGYGANRIVRIQPDLSGIVDTFAVDFPDFIDGLATDGMSIYAMAYGTDSVYQVDIMTRKITRAIYFGVNIFGGMSFAADRNSIFVGGTGPRIYEIDATDGHIKNSFSPDIQPYGVGYSCSSQVLFIGNYGSETEVLDPNTGQVLQSFSPGYDGLASDESMANFISLNPSSGTVPVGGNQTVDVWFSATRLAGGDYHSFIPITSNDPVTNPENIPVLLQVAGRPLISVTPDTLDLGNAWVGYGRVEGVQVTNLGSQTLHVTSVTSNNPVFVPAVTSFSVLPFKTRSIDLTFTPSDTGVYDGLLSISSDDSLHSTVSINLTGKGLYPPIIEVAPDSVLAALSPGDSTAKTIVISNSGKGNLTYSISGTRNYSAASGKYSVHSSFNPVRKATLNQSGPTQSPPKLAGTYSGSKLAFGISDYGEIMPFQFPIGTEHLEVGAYVSGYTVAFISAGSDHVDYAAYQNRSGLTPWSYREIRNDTATLVAETKVHTSGNELEITRTFTFQKSDQYVSVQTFIKNISAVPVTNVVFKEFADWDVDGDYLDNWGFDSTRCMIYAYLTHYCTIVPSQPPSLIDIDGWEDYMQRATIENVPSGIVMSYDGLELLHFDLGLLSAGDSASVTNAYASANTLAELQAVADMALGSSWLSVNPLSGNVPPGGSSNVTLSVVTGDLTVGKYSSTLEVMSNDPLTPEAAVPVNLTVTLTKSIAKPLVANWNLASWNVGTEVDSASALLAGIRANLKVALGFDGAGLTYDPSVPSQINSLKVMDPLHGYWLKMISADTLSLSGTIVNKMTPISLRSGWNLVGYLPSATDSTVHALGSVLDSAIIILGFDGGGLTFDPSIPRQFNTLTLMKPGFGYWIKMKTAKTLVYPSGVIAPPGSSHPLASAAKVSDVSAQIAPTREWISLWGKNVNLDGQLLPVGTIIKAVDKGNVTCGKTVVTNKGEFGLMPIYADDPLTEADEGPQQGEYVDIYVGETKLPKAVKWTEFGDVVDFNDVLSAIGVGLTGLPKEFALRQNYPNPFNPTTTITYELPHSSHVVLRVYNVLGQEVAKLADEQQKAGYYSVVWNCLTKSGGLASSGVYFCAISADEYSKVIKMLLLK
jgi:immune inhibitor A